MNTSLKPAKKALFAVILVSGLALTMIVGPRSARAQKDDINAIYKRAMEARKQKNNPAFLENMLKVSALLPEYPPVRVQLAGAYALNGKNDEAAKELGVLAAKGLSLPVLEGEEFASIKSLPAFKDLLLRFMENNTSTNYSAPAFELDDKTLITEGLACDPRRFRFLVSSVHRGKIVQRDREGIISDFSSSEDGLGAVMGMKIDDAGRFLWACTAGIPQFEGLKDEDNGRTGVLQYDLARGTLAGKFSFPEKGHLFGDLALHPSGDIYVTDSNSPAIYKLTPGKAAKWENVLKGESFLNLQGLDFSDDGKLLFVADYLKGIFVIDLDSREPALLAAPENAALVGIDGLYYHNGGLIAVQNGVAPHRVIRVILDKSRRKIAGVDILENNHRLFNEPTLGVIVNNIFYYIANSQWNAFDEKGKLAAEDKLQRPVILSLALGK
ncbi:MAG: SMP-30/gluconolactonase/LRE family protein [Candidatus Aminicenantales bacterium]